MTGKSFAFIQEGDSTDRMKIYLDVCCLNCPFDDQTQDRIHLESEAVVLILKHVRSGNWEWISSEAVDYEVGQTPDVERRHRVESLIRYAGHTVLIEKSVVKRVPNLRKSVLASMMRLIWHVPSILMLMFF